MASSNRDLTIGLISKMDRFDLKDAANQLEDLGDKAKEAGKGVGDLGDSSKDLGKLGDSAKQAGREVEAGMEKAEKAVKSVASGGEARELDRFFDKMGDSAKRAGRDVDDGMDKAKAGVDDFKQESQQTARESAASFSGSFEDAADAVQETLANALSGFGPLGAAAGIAAAAGLGTLLSKINEAKEKVKELRDAFTGGLIEGKGRLDLDFINERLQDVASSDAFKGLREDAVRAGIPVADLMLALAGDPAAMERTARALEKIPEVTNQTKGAMPGLVDAANSLRSELGYTTQGLTDAKDAADAYASATVDVEGSIANFANTQKLVAEQSARTAEQVSGVESALSRVGSEAGSVADVMQEKAAAMAAASKDPKDSWTDFADEVKLSAGDIVKVLDEQTKAIIDYQSNLEVVAERQNEDFLAWVTQQPKMVAAAYADGTKKQRDAIFRAWERNVGAAQGEGVVAGLDGKAPELTSAGKRARDRVQAGAGEKVVVQVGAAVSESDIARVRGQIKARFGTIEIPVVPKQFGQGRYIP